MNPPGNALRQLGRYADAECRYLTGLERCPDDPFLKFRLVDLWLMTCQHQRAERMLAQLKARYPYALEQMFAIPVPDQFAHGDNISAPMCSDDADLIWIVAADPVYIERFGVRFARGISTLQASSQVKKIKLHLHIVTEPEVVLPLDVLNTISSLVPTQITKRTVALKGASPNQRKAVFASERFLLLPELLKKYDRPLLVTDIDMDVLNHPANLLDAMGDGDIGHTRFGVVREAWDMYPATVLLFQPTEESQKFCTQLAGVIVSLLNSHPEPWFVDQIALYRLIESGMTGAKFSYLKHILTDTVAPEAYFRLLHGSWQA